MFLSLGSCQPAEVVTARETCTRVGAVVKNLKGGNDTGPRRMSPRTSRKARKGHWEPQEGDLVTWQRTREQHSCLPQRQKKPSLTDVMV